MMSYTGAFFTFFVGTIIYHTAKAALGFGFDPQQASGGLFWVGFAFLYAKYILKAEPRP